MSDDSLNHIPPHLRVRVPYTPGDGTQGYIILGDLVALGYRADPDPDATREWTATATEEARH